MPPRRQEYTVKDIENKQKISDKRSKLTHNPFVALREEMELEQGYPLSSFDEQIRTAFASTLFEKIELVPHGFAIRPTDLPGVNLAEFYEAEGGGLQVLLRYGNAASGLQYFPVIIAADGSIRTGTFPPELKGVDTPLVYGSILGTLATLGMNKPTWGGAVALPGTTLLPTTLNQPSAAGAPSATAQPVTPPSGFNLPTIQGPQIPPGAHPFPPVGPSAMPPAPPTATYEHQLRLSVLAHHEAFIAAVSPAVETRGGGFSEYFGAVFRRGMLLDAGESGNALYEYRFQEPLSQAEVGMFTQLYEDRWRNRRDAVACAALDKQMQDILVAHGYGAHEWVRTKREKIVSGERYATHPSRDNPDAEKKFYAEQVQDYITQHFA